jgi:beta-lactamase superfamily II metal-dependent hydrolase
MDRLELMVFNVGQGLSVALVERPEKYVTLIDLGADKGFTPLKSLSLKYSLRPDLLYITHPHADHLADVETALDSRFMPDGIYYQDYDWEDVKEREKPELAYRIDRLQELVSSVPFRQYGGNARVTVWRYTPEKAKSVFGEESYVNNSSLFIVYRWQGFKISIAGDLESDAISAVVGSEKVQESAKGTDILIPPHHGHRNGFPTEWSSKMGRPHVSIISVQERDPNVDSRYGSSDFARGVPYEGVTRYALTTRRDGSILVSMWYDETGKPTWSFSRT